MTRGIVVPLMTQQIVARWRYLAGQSSITTLDPYIRSGGAPDMCPAIYYLLHGHNGGKDPTAPDPADRWSLEGSTHVNRTADCVAGVAWGMGWDRYQPQRFAHIYDGWINTDSMREDAAGPGRCFIRIDRPEPGAAIVYGSDPHHKTHGVAVGHIGGIVGYHFAEWDPGVAECWDAIEVVDISSRGAAQRANLLRTGAPWRGKDAWFVRSIMRP